VSDYPAWRVIREDGHVNLAVPTEIEMAFPYSKILCPVAFDENSMEALDEAVKIARHFGASIILVHVVPMVVQFGEVPVPPELYENEIKDAKARMAEIVRTNLDQVEHTSLFYSGDVVEGILQAVDKFKPDLIVMATHGRSGLAHLFLGSVAEAVVRKVPCPVMTIRPGKAEPRAD
jgi:universal stress protein A